MIGFYQQEGLDFFDTVKQALEQYLNMETEYVGFFTPIQSAYNPLRQQYDSYLVLKSITEMDKKRYDYRLAVVDVDIYATGMNFIFGLAHPLWGAAIVSIKRLRGKKLIERLHKEVVHEMGHLLGLTHCPDSGCVMHFSNTIEDTDAKGSQLCNRCRSKLEG